VKHFAEQAQNMSNLSKTLLGGPFIRRTLGALGVLVTVGTAVWLARPTIPDPEYRGKRLSEYVAMLPMTIDTGNGYARGYLGGQDLSGMTQAERSACLEKITKDTKEATGAIKMLDSKSLPLLLKWLGRKEPATEKAWETVRSKVFVLFRWSGVRGGGISQCRTENRRWQAVTAFMDLHRSGCDLSRIVPQFIGLARDPDLTVRRAGRFMLRYVDSEAFTRLTNEDDGRSATGISGP
jgi:hypothetical protein